MLKESIQEFWLKEAQPALMDFIRLPSKSTAFDPQWKENGYLKGACKLAADWIRKAVPEAKCEILEFNGKTPCLFVEIEGHQDNDKTIAFYGHLDKQPEATGWRDGLGPWTPVLEGEYLYGRGASDDGYSVYAMITAIKGLQRCKMPYPRIVAIFETQEESGSEDLPDYLLALKERVGSPECFIILDNQCGDYERLWLNTSLRGTITGTLTVKAMDFGIHSGTFSGLTPDPLSIAQALVARIHDPITGRILLESLHTTIPELRIQQLKEVANELGNNIWKSAPLLPGVCPKHANNHENLIHSIWEPTLTIIGIDGIPSIKDAGNVIQGEVALRLSFRTPPNIDMNQAMKDIVRCLTQDIPYGCQTVWNDLECNPGWSAPAQKGKFERLFSEAAFDVFNKKTLANGQGASIGFVPKFEELFPATEIVLIGVLGPHSNAHAPDESLNIRYVQQLIQTISIVLSKA